MKRYGMAVGVGAASVLMVAVISAAAQNNGSGAAQDLRLVPFPKSGALETGRFFFRKSLAFEISDGQGELPAQLLNADLQRAGKVRMVGISKVSVAQLDTAQLDLRGATFPVQYKYGVYDVANHKFVRFESVDGQAVFGGIDGHGAQAQLGGGAEDANGDLAAVGHEQLARFGFIRGGDVAHK